MGDRGCNCGESVATGCRGVLDGDRTVALLCPCKSGEKSVGLVGKAALGCKIWCLTKWSVV